MAQTPPHRRKRDPFRRHILGVYKPPPAPKPDPPCCRCDPALCAADDTGEHCNTQSCGVCLHGCPAPVGVPCCREEAV